jgi:hypothetical protein
MTSTEIEAIKREILDAIKRLNDLNGDQHHGVETVISLTSLGRSNHPLSKVRWYFDRLAQDGMIRIVAENSSGSFAVELDARGWERTEMSKEDFQGTMKPNVVIDDVPAPPSPYHTFVSHSGQDREFVDKFVNDLRSVGIDAWYSKSEIKAGDSIPQKMDEGLEACKFFIAVVSKSSIASPYVKVEIDSAISRRAGGGIKKIIPVKLDGTNPPTILSGLLWVDFASREYDAAMKEITDSIFDKDLRTPLGPLPTDLDGGGSL